ncbi:MAG: DNA modification methylase [Planctomycetaceae bacterium]|nr:DNA modification methylase [Planctomycetaceae bacterium]
MNNTITIELREIHSVKPYERNPRLNDKAVDAVAASLKEFGFRQPIVVDSEGIIIAGHTRYKAALRLGLQKIPVHTATDLTPEQVKAYRLADNRTGEIAEWDLDILPVELSELQEAGFDMNVLAFSERELHKLLKSELKQGLTDPDAVPETPDKAVTQKGDLWILGEHKLLCGDCTEINNLQLLCGKKKADMIFCDPPYNVALGKPQRNEYSKRHRLIENDDLGSEFKGFLTKAVKNMMSFNTGAAYICMSSSELQTLHEAFLEAGGKWASFIVWCKNSFTLSRSDYQHQYEAILYGWNKDVKRYWCGDRSQSDVWEYKRPKKNDLHPTMKPVELVARAVRNSSKPGGTVLDTFGGSGTTVIACEQTGRKCLMMETDQLYCDVIAKRWEDFTGKKAQRIAGKESE